LKDWILDFLTTQSSDFAKLEAFLKDQQKACSVVESFSVSVPRKVAGWLFSQLQIDTAFVARMKENNVREIAAAKSDVNGKYYRGRDQDIISFVAWLNTRLRQRGCTGQVKVGEEMADLSYGRGAG
jgi:hypothetical protein